MTRRTLPALSLVRVFAVYPVAVTALSVVNVVAPQRSGPLALGEVLAPHLLLPLVLLVPFALARGAVALRMGLALAVLVAAARFLPGVVSLPPHAPPAAAQSIRVLSWNLEVGVPPVAGVLAVLESTNADLVALQELTPGHAAAMEADRAITSRFAYRAMYPETGAGGVGLLSRFPLSEANAATTPALVEARLTLPDGTVVRVVDAHPFPAAIATATSFRIPIGFEAARRDADVARIRQRVDPVVAAGAPIIVVGDFNLTDREPAHADLARGLIDAHLEVGEGTGSTWRPDRMKFLPFGVMRIDYLLSGGGLRPTAIGEDCTPRGSDHCIVLGTLVDDSGPGQSRGAVPAVVTSAPSSRGPA